MFTFDKHLDLPPAVHLPHTATDTSTYITAPNSLLPSRYCQVILRSPGHTCRGQHTTSLATGAKHRQLPRKRTCKSPPLHQTLASSTQTTWLPSQSVKGGTTRQRIFCSVPLRCAASRTNELTDTRRRESFDNIYLDLSKEPGKCRLAESGLGWKPAGGSTFTLDKSELSTAQWSRAAKGYELKIHKKLGNGKDDGVVQLDGFKQDVSELS
jgi:hypothetical protein